VRALAFREELGRGAGDGILVVDATTHTLGGIDGGTDTVLVTAIQIAGGSRYGRNSSRNSSNSLFDCGSGSLFDYDWGCGSGSLFDYDWGCGSGSLFDYDWGSGSGSLFDYDWGRLCDCDRENLKSGCDLGLCGLALGLQCARLLHSGC
jgi:hypothetical protein